MKRILGLKPIQIQVDMILTYALRSVILGPIYKRAQNFKRG